MKKIVVFVFILALLGAVNTFAQQQPIWSTVARGTTLPSTIPAEGYLFFRTADSTLWVSAAESWVMLRSGFDISCNYGNLQLSKIAAVAAGLPLRVEAYCPVDTLSFNDADSALVLENYNTIYIVASDTIPQGAIIRMLGRGAFYLETGVNLHIAGKFEGGLSRRFYGPGTVTTIDEVRPEWWGARDDSTFNSLSAFQSAVDAFGVGRYGAVVLSPGSRYLIDGTVRFPKSRSSKNRIRLVGNGAKIYTTANDTLFVLSSTSPHTESFTFGENSISDLRLQQIGTQGDGVGIAIYNSNRQLIENCYFQDFNDGLVFVNVDSGWTEHNRAYNLAFVNCDTAIVFNAMATGTSSFRNNFFSSIAIPGMHGAKIIKDGGQAVGIATIGTGQTGGVPGVPNIYQNTWLNVSMALSDSCTGVYIGGRVNNIFAQVSFENFGGDGTRSRAWHFGANATNIQGWIYSDFATRGDLDKLIYNESGVAPQHIYTQIIGQSNNQAHGNSVIWDDVHQMYIQSVISNNAASGFKAVIGDTQVVFESLITTGGIPRFRYSESTPLEFRRIFPNDGITRLAPIRAHNIGQSRFVSDSTVLDVRNTTFVQFGSNTPTIDSLTAFKGGIAGQSLIVTFDDDSTLLANLIGGAGSGRLFLINNKTTLTRRGMKSYFICQGQSTPDSITGTFWREVFRQYNNGEDRSLGIGDTVGVTLTAPGTATINPVAHNVILDTYASAALDTATTLTGQIGDIIVVGIRNSGRNILFQRSSNFILESNVLLDEVGDKLVLMAVTTTQWQKLAFVDSSGTFTVADITSVIAGTGMNGGGISGDVTLNVIGSDGIKADADTTRILLSLGSGLKITSGAGAVDSLSIKLNGSTLSLSSSGLQVPTGGITNTQIANNTILNADINGSAAIVGSKLASETITETQMNWAQQNTDSVTSRVTFPATYKYKTADESVTSSAALQNDDHLQFTLVAGQKYAIYGFLFVSTNGTANIKFDFEGGTATATNFIATFDGAATQQNTSTLATDVSYVAGLSDYPVFVVGSIEVNAGGTFILRFAQDTSNGVNTTLKRGSWMSLTLIP